MRLLLAREFGGGPAYWLDPGLAEEVVSTAVDIVVTEQSRKDRRE